MTGEEWAVLEPLINQCGPPCKVPIKNLRQRIEGIFWRHENGAKWRTMPAECGPWWKRAQTFIDWSRLGAWERLLERVRARLGVLGTAFLDGTSSRAHQKVRRKRGTSKERDDREALGRSRGGFGTQASGDRRWQEAGRRLRCGAGPSARGAARLIEKLPAPPGWIVGDRGLSAHALRELIWDTGPKPAIPPKRNEASVAYRSWIYQNRNIVERLWARLRRMASRRHPLRENP